MIKVAVYTAAMVLACLLVFCMASVVLLGKYIFALFCRLCAIGALVLRGVLHD